MIHISRLMNKKENPDFQNTNVFIHLYEEENSFMHLVLVHDIDLN